MSDCTLVGRSAKLAESHALFAVLAEGSVERVIIAVIIIGGHDVFSCMRKGCQGVGLTDTMDRREPVSDSGWTVCGFGFLKYPPLFVAESRVYPKWGRRKRRNAAHKNRAPKALLCSYVVRYVWRKSSPV